MRVLRTTLGLDRRLTITRYRKMADEFLEIDFNESKLLLTQVAGHQYSPKVKAGTYKDSNFLCVLFVF